MGLLDEAIRDHLELKRRRGADPSEVAREQHEALDPIADRARAGEVDENGQAASAGDPAVGGPARAPSEDAVPSTDTETPLHAKSEDSTGAGAITGMEETAELDMKAVFEHGTVDEPDDTGQVDQPIPGQEHLQFGQDAAPHAESQT